MRHRRPSPSAANGRGGTVHNGGTTARRGSSRRHSALRASSHRRNLAQHTAVGLQSPGENGEINSTTIRKFDRVKEILERELAYDKKGKQRGVNRATQWRNEVAEAKKTI